MNDSSVMGRPCLFYITVLRVVRIGFVWFVMGGACGTYGGDERGIQNIGRKT
jgi:hypothetical protein